MDSGRIGAIFSAVIALVSLILALGDMEGNMIVTSLFVLVFGIIASKRCSLEMNRFIFIAAVVTLACTVLSVTVFAQETIQIGEDAEFGWFYVIALLHAIPLVPLTFAAFVITASVSDASYNWAVVRGLSPFIAMGMQVPGFVVEYLDPKNVDNGYILYTLLTMFVVMLVCGLAMSHYMRKNRMVINENGMVVLE